LRDAVDRLGLRADEDRLAELGDDVRFRVEVLRFVDPERALLDRFTEEPLRAERPDDPPPRRCAMALS